MRRAGACAAVVGLVLVLAGCSSPRLEAAIAYRPGPTPTTSVGPSTVESDIGGDTVVGSDEVPSVGKGTFTVASGGTDVVGTGTTLVRYRIELENGINWGSIPAWTPDSFAAATDAVLADPNGWIASANHPVTDAAQRMNGASWSFQRVSGSAYRVRVLLATPGTVDRMCGSAGLRTLGQYSCQLGNLILINLRRWLSGAPGFPVNLAGYRTMVINHEMGHQLGFKHMRCPSPGTLAPVMMQETMNLGGCLPNIYPFAPDGAFLRGPFAP
jgi:hypothetical protein